MSEIVEAYQRAADRIMRTLRVQHVRAMAEDNEHRPHDADLYAVTLAGYGALLYRAAGRRKGKDEPPALAPIRS